MGYKETAEDGSNRSSASSILFLYSLRSGQAEKSFGMNVARMAGLPQSIVSMATEVSNAMEEGNSTNDASQ